MTKIPPDCRYTDSHLWFRPSLEGDEGFLGLTDHAQARLGDLISAELPRGGVTIGADDTFAYLEGLLEAVELTAPGNMEILEVNPRLEINPEIINRSAYEGGWIAKVRFKSVVRWMDAPGYARYLESGVIAEGA